MGDGELEEVFRQEYAPDYEARSPVAECAAQSVSELDSGRTVCSTIKTARWREAPNASEVGGASAAPTSLGTPLGVFRLPITPPEGPKYKVVVLTVHIIDLQQH